VTSISTSSPSVSAAVRMKLIVSPVTGFSIVAPARMEVARAGMAGLLSVG
jgi:hypothetical protein